MDKIHGKLKTQRHLTMHCYLLDASGFILQCKDKDKGKRGQNISFITCNYFQLVLSTAVKG